MEDRLQALGDESAIVDTFVIGDTFKAAHVILSYPYVVSPFIWSFFYI
jgi:hypothetical protein